MHTRGLHANDETLVHKVKRWNSNSLWPTLQEFNRTQN